MVKQDAYLECSYEFLPGKSYNEGEDERVCTCRSHAREGFVEIFPSVNLFGRKEVFMI